VSRWGYNGSGSQATGSPDSDRRESVLAGTFALFDDAIPVLIQCGSKIR
jgi:hypothetical protein